MEESIWSRPLYLKHRCNSSNEIFKALEEGFDGVELDLVWGEHGGILLGHEHRAGGEDFQMMLDIPCPIAINVKEYGMALPLAEMLKDHPQHFVFDVPGPELHDYLEAGVRYFGRRSELEFQYSPYGILLDSFESNPKMVNMVVPTALISPTLRGLDEWSEEIRHAAHYIITKKLP